MPINEVALRQILQSYGPKGQGTPGNVRRSDPDSSTANNRPDEISISSAGQELQRMIKAAQQADDVRSARVQELRTQLRTGSYQLNAQSIANSMLGVADDGGNG